MSENNAESDVRLTRDEQGVLMCALDRFHANESTYGGVYRAVEAIIADHLARVTSPTGGHA